jgi:hypothetical protein
MPNVRPGILARIVKADMTESGAIEIPELIGRIVFVEQVYRSNDSIHTLEGPIVVCSGNFSNLLWRVSSKSPLPVLLRTENEVRRLSSHAIPVFDIALRPLLDQNLYVSEKEVKELYSTKEKECLVSQ